MWGLSLFFGGLVGLSLGLTGGGGALFAVPLLVYGQGISMKEAVGVSLAAVGTTSFIGFLFRIKRGEVEPGTGLLFAIAGMLGAPLGTWLAGLIPETALLLTFAGLMILVAIRLWQQASRQKLETTNLPPPDSDVKPTCRRDATGKLIFTLQCATLLMTSGLSTGLLSGLFGVGGGFVIVPALVLCSGMPIHRAVGTSLMIISLVSLSGIASLVWAGRTIPPVMTSLFIAGGTGGMFVGQQISTRLSGPALQKSFVVGILAVALFLIAQNFHFSISW